MKNKYLFFEKIKIKHLKEQHNLSSTNSNTYCYYANYNIKIMLDPRKYI